jgi:hypothetical protein
MIEELLGQVFSMRLSLSLSLITTTVSPVPGSITGPLFPGMYKYGDLALQVGEVPNLRQ